MLNVQESMGNQQHPVTLSFTDLDLEREYRESYFQKTLPQSRIALILGIILYVIFAGLDVWIVPEQAHQIWLIRFGFVIPILLGILIVSFTPYFQKYFQLFLSVASLIGGCGILGILLVTDGLGNFFYSTSLMLLLMWSFTFSGMRFVFALASCTLVIIAFEIVAIFLKPYPLYVLVDKNFFVVSALTIEVFVGYTIESYSRNNFINNRIINQERQDNENLLLNMLPQSIVEQLKERPETIAQRFESITILFADIVGFTPLSATLNPTELVEILNQIFSSFDRLTDDYELEKIKTIGDAYMVAGGLPIPSKDHAQAIANLALEMQRELEQFNQTSRYSFELRIGIHTGPAIAGVIGIKKFVYDIWGDSVNIASRMESHGLPGKIQVSEQTYQRLKDCYSFEDRGAIEVKGKGKMQTYLLIRKKG